MCSTNSEKLKSSSLQILLSLFFQYEIPVRYMLDLLFIFPSLHLCSIFWLISSTSQLTNYLCLQFAVSSVCCVFNVSDFFFFYFYETMLGYFSNLSALFFNSVIYIFSHFKQAYSFHLIRSEVAGDVLLPCVVDSLMLESFFMCSETWWGFNCANSVRIRVDVPQEQSWFSFFQVSRSLGSCYINFLTQRLQDNICNVHLNPESVLKADLYLYILRRDFLCLLGQNTGKTGQASYYLPALLGSLVLLHLSTETVGLRGFWPCSICIRRDSRSRPHLLSSDGRKISSLSHTNTNKALQPNINTYT